MVKRERFLGFTKKSSTLPRVVWAEDPKNGLRFEIEPSYDVVPTRSQVLTDGQSRCMRDCSLLSYQTDGMLSPVYGVKTQSHIIGAVWIFGQFKAIILVHF